MGKQILGHAPRERVSWNAWFAMLIRGWQGHAPRERVSWNCTKMRFELCRFCHAPRERVSWNFYCHVLPILLFSHAPRERVSWNCKIVMLCHSFFVTLHVSVWVEMEIFKRFACFDMSRSTWACELKFCIAEPYSQLSVKSRSTWACELKYKYEYDKLVDTRHAPRERVSWNGLFKSSRLAAFWSRSTWACELKCIVLIKIVPVFARHAPRERVSWNALWQRAMQDTSSHAPRERVSWNAPLLLRRSRLCVTLHVSVWVEIALTLGAEMKPTSRSTWACELKLQCKKFVVKCLTVTLHVSVWVEI